MRVVVLYRPNTEHERRVLEFAHDFKDRHDERYLELLSLDTVQGSDLARIYGVVQYPAVIVLDREGKLLKLWEGEQMPLISELAYYEQL